VKAEIEKIKFKLLINVELYGLVLAPKAENRGYHQIWEANLQPTLGAGPNFSAFINILTSMS